MEKKKRGFFERLTGSIQMNDDEVEEEPKKYGVSVNKSAEKDWINEEEEEAELAIDIYETPTDIMVKTMVAGVRPEDLEINIARDTLTISGKREETRVIDESNYFVKELYWGKFSRTLSLPQEVEPEQVEATEKHGLLTVKIKKVDKEKKNNVKVRSI